MQYVLDSKSRALPNFRYPQPRRTRNMIAPFATQPGLGAVAVARTSQFSMTLYSVFDDV